MDNAATTSSQVKLELQTALMAAIGFFCDGQQREALDSLKVC
jgi:hypothetical protein